MEDERNPIYCSLKHQTGVTERSIGGNDGHPAKHVIHDMVIRNDADGIGAGNVTELDGNHLLGAVEPRSGRFLEYRPAQRMKHKLINVHERQHAAGDGQGGNQDDGYARKQPADALPSHESEQYGQHADSDLERGPEMQYVQGEGQFRAALIAKGADDVNWIGQQQEGCNKANRQPQVRIAEQALH
jgi:hypothetical protein